MPECPGGPGSSRWEGGALLGSRFIQPGQGGGQAQVANELMLVLSLEN